MSLARLGLRHAARCSPGRGAAAAGALLAPRAPVAARMQLLGPLQHQQPWACVPLVARSSSSDTATSASSVQAAPAAPAAAATASGPPPHLAHPRNQSMFCRMCGGAMQLIQPEGDREWRHVCGACSYIDYLNPKLVVGCIVEHDGKILLCRRAIEPCRGLWTVPAGFMELNESSAAGAARETMEEANAAVTIVAPYTHLDIPVIGQAYILFRAQLAPPFTFSPGPESLEVALFEPEHIPFNDIAFSSIAVTLRSYVAEMASGEWHVHHGVINRLPGTAPNDPAGYTLQDHFAVPVAAGHAGGSSGSGQ